MLILTREVEESIRIGDNFTITILDTGSSVRVYVPEKNRAYLPEYQSRLSSAALAP